MHSQLESVMSGDPMIVTTVPIRIVLIQHHRLLRAGMKALFEGWADIELVGEADWTSNGANILMEYEPDIMLIDLNSQDSGGVLGLLAALHGSNSHIKPIILADTKDNEMLVRAVTLGAMGVVFKDQSPDILREAIRKVHAGEVWLERKLTASALRQMSDPNSHSYGRESRTKSALLSNREREIIALVCRGYQNLSIGQHLAISEATVRHHLTSIFYKLGVQNRVELATFALAHGIVKHEQRAEGTCLETVFQLP